MRSSKNVVLGAALGVLVVAATLWAEGARPSLPLIKSDQATENKAAAPAIVGAIDHYESASAENAYHAKIADPNVPWQEKCRLAIRHGRLHLLSSDIGGTLGGTLERGSSTLRVRVLCPEEVAVFEIPANFEVHSGPHPEEIQEMSFETDMHAIEGRGTDVGGFSSLHLVGGTSNGYKSPGHTSLIPAGDGTFAIDSTFNIGYRIEFVGAKGGPLEGSEGVIESTILMKAVGK